MVQGKKALTQLDQMLDELIGENPQPEDILGEDGLHPYTKIRTLSWLLRDDAGSLEGR